MACAGAKVANHAEVNLVPKNLCARIPDGLATRRRSSSPSAPSRCRACDPADATLGETFAVIGLGLIGQLGAQLLRASGARSSASISTTARCDLARELGADAPSTGRATWPGPWRRSPADAAWTESSSPPPPAPTTRSCSPAISAATAGASWWSARWAWKCRGGPTTTRSCPSTSRARTGPGRYDPSYEEQGHDYPIGYVRWTEQRNMEAFLHQCAIGAVRTDRLISHRFPIERAEEAYQLIGGGDPLGVLLEYPAKETPSRTVAVAVPKPAEGAVRVGVIGAGGFAAGVLVPAMAAAKDARLVAIASNRGFSARHLADKYKFETCTTDADSITGHAALDAVFIVTRHDQHAAQASAALRAQKHVFVEKPVAIDRQGLADVLAAQAASGRILTVGFNRRFSPLARELFTFFEKRRSPLVMHYRVNAGEIPADSWIHDPAVGGGRIIGEGCHFIDLCAYLAGAPPVSVFAQGISPAGGARADDNVDISVRFADGSVATIAYVATGDATAGKERLEVLGDGASAVLEDFRTLSLRRSGKERNVKKMGQDKGHRAGVLAFIEAVKAGGAPPIPVATIAAVTEATFAAVESLATGEPVSLGS